MVRAELLGQHSHQTVCGKNIHIWQRAGKFIARGYIDGKRFGETLGADTNDAAARLRRLMVDIENRAYLRPSEKRKRPLARDLGGEPQRSAAHDPTVDTRAALAVVGRHDTAGLRVDSKRSGEARQA